MKRLLFLIIALSAATAHAQTIIDNNGNVVGQIYDSRRNYEGPQIDDPYTEPPAGGSSGGYGTEFFNMMRGLQIEQQMLDQMQARKRADDAAGWRRAEREAWLHPKPPGVKTYWEHMIPEIRTLEKRGDYHGILMLVLAYGAREKAWVKAHGGYHSAAALLATATCPRDPATLAYLHWLGWSDQLLAQARANIPGYKAQMQTDADPEWQAFEIAYWKKHPNADAKSIWADPEFQAFSKAYAKKHPLGK
jgi:hypothetical protein